MSDSLQTKMGLLVDVSVTRTGGLRLSYFGGHVWDWHPDTQSVTTLGDRLQGDVDGLNEALLLFTKGE